MTLQEKPPTFRKLKIIGKSFGFLLVLFLTLVTGIAIGNSDEPNINETNSIEESKILILKENNNLEILFSSNDYFVDFIPSNLSKLDFTEKQEFIINNMASTCDFNYLMTNNNPTYEKACKNSIIKKINKFRDE